MTRCKIKEILHVARVCRAHVNMVVLCPSKLQFCYKKKITFMIQNCSLLARITLLSCLSVSDKFHTVSGTWSTYPFWTLTLKFVQISS